MPSPDTPSSGANSPRPPAQTIRRAPGGSWERWPHRCWKRSSWRSVTSRRVGATGTQAVPLPSQSSVEHGSLPAVQFQPGQPGTEHAEGLCTYWPLLVGLLGARRVGRRTHARLGQQVPPVLALTGSPSVGDQEAGFEAGMAEVLTRPLTLEALGAALDGERVLTSEPQRACARSSVRVVHSRAGDCARCEGLQEPMSGSRCKSGTVPPP
jgi:hypothetical protein